MSVVSFEFRAFHSPSCLGSQLLCACSGSDSILPNTELKSKREVEMLAARYTQPGCFEPASRETTPNFSTLSDLPISTKLLQIFSSHEAFFVEFDFSCKILYASSDFQVNIDRDGQDFAILIVESKQNLSHGHCSPFD